MTVPPGSLKTISLCLVAISNKRMMNSQDVPPADAQRRQTSPFTYVGMLVVGEAAVSRYSYTTLSSPIGVKSPQNYSTANLSFDLPFLINYREPSPPTSVSKLKASVETVGQPHIHFSVSFQQQGKHKRIRYTQTC